MVLVLSAQCTTRGCLRAQRFMSVFEANHIGNDAPGRCAQCCEEISQALYLASADRPATAGSPQITRAVREAVVAVGCSLDGERAKVNGSSLEFPIVRSALQGVEFSWETVLRVFARSNGAFQS